MGGTKCLGAALLGRWEKSKCRELWGERLGVSRRLLNLFVAKSLLGVQNWALLFTVLEHVCEISF